jgi:hypothetical protein
MRKHKQKQRKANHGATQEIAPATFGSAYPPQSKPELDGRYNMAQTPMYQPNSNPKQGSYQAQTIVTFWERHS